MITIAIADPNSTYPNGLRTILEQLDGLRVVIPDQANWYRECADIIPADILMIDEYFYAEYGNTGGNEALPFPREKILILTMDNEDQPPVVEHTIRKGSGKKDFEEMIRKLVPGVKGKPLLQALKIIKSNDT